MSPQDKHTSKELAAARQPRVATRRKDRHERYLHFLRLALRTRLDNGYSADNLAEVISQGDNELNVLADSAGGRIYSRRRPKAIDTDETCTVYIDECGAHSLKAKEKLKTFCLAAVIIRDSDFKDVDSRWKQWKRDYLGAATKRVHEPDIRYKRKSFWCGGDDLKRMKAVAALDRILERLNFTSLAVVVNRPEYVRQIGIRALDDSLPQHPYLMSMHFLAERLAMALYSHFNGARARLVIESLEASADAKMQYEFSRLFLDGTSYVASAWFRQQFLPGIEFRVKEQNSTGLQLADLLARPCAEKIQRPASTPARWPVFREKLCPGVETANSIIGLKIVPWDDRYQGIWKS